MTPDPVLLNALRNAPVERVREVLQAAAWVLAAAQDWPEIERLVRERLGLSEALRILEGDDKPTPDAGTALRSGMAADYLTDHQYWRDRAEEARARAEQMRTAEAKRVLLRIGASYDRLAEHAERRAPQPKPGTP
jgi:hypothetical protein